ncbi:hypothetical protein LTR36_009688 [Oleoguttula mirabilis]|uniref:BTB domain-containing protein n=1 Tax=Oleoguttula mirabilis TaxID=1507867 RepID=A0AAV9J5R2_9PEZI|nr:hypothetical protein LTR36_009688 [Oleoguttula mirabilis]
MASPLPSTPDKFPTTQMFDEIIVVIVGEGSDSKSFSVHKGVACFHSGFFRAATKSCYKEGKEGVIELPDEEVDVVEQFVKWLYTRQVDKPVEHHAAFLAMSKLWTFSDRRDVPLLANTMVDAMRDVIFRTRKLPTQALHYIYENTTPNSELRRFVIDLIARTASTDRIMTDENRDRWPQEALWDLVQQVWCTTGLKKMLQRIIPILQFLADSNNAQYRTINLVIRRNMASQNAPLPSTLDHDKFDHVIEVKVGQGMFGADCMQSFFVHHGVACMLSGYFRAATNGNFMEAASGIVKLPTEDANIFGQFVAWMYTRRFDLDSMDTNTAFSTMCKLWAFADRRQVPLLANVTINALRDRIAKDWTVPTPQLNYIYENTTADAGLRRFCIRVIANACKSESLTGADKREMWPEDALFDALKILWEQRDHDKTKRWIKEDLLRLDMCKYHIHSAGVRCNKHE